MNLAIEQNEDLLKEYGRAFAYTNVVEVMLNIFLLVKGKLGNSEDGIGNKILQEMMGKKIELVKNLLPSEILKDLSKLNAKRITLAHGVSASSGVDTYIIMHKEKTEILTKDSLVEITELAKSILTKIFPLINPIKSHGS